MKSALEAIASGRVEPVYLVHGDRVLAEPEAERLAAALAERFGCEPLTVRRPDGLADAVADLRTFSLFASGKVVVVIESGALADRTTAGALFDEVRSILPWKGAGGELAGRAREAAMRLLQILRLFDIGAIAGQAAEALARLPPAVFAGKSGRAAKGKGAVEELRAGLEPLLEAALAAGLTGLGEGDASLVADLVREGLPERHALILVESAVAGGHPLFTSLAKRGAVIEAGAVTIVRGKYGGLAELAAELERESGVRIERDALEALAARTLRSEDRRRGGEEGAVVADSTARFAGEYRKLATLAAAAPAGSKRAPAIDLELVKRNVVDRGEEDVFALLDAIGAGRAAEALARLARKIQGAEDPVLERLSFFALFAAFCRHLVAVRGAAGLAGATLEVRDYNRFKSGLAAKLSGAIAGIETNPLHGLHEFRLFKAAQAAARLPAATIDRLPALVLETERRLKGESGEPDAALAALVLALAKPAG